MAFSITLIKDPPYVFLPKVEESKSLEEQPRLPLGARIAQAGLRAFMLVRFLFASIRESAWETISYSWSGFKITVLGYHGNLANFSPPLGLIMGVLRIFTWVICLGRNFIFKTGAFFVQKAFPLHDEKTRLDLLLPYTNQGINLEHLRCLDETINMSGVPQEVQVKDLLEIFDQANFKNRATPGYVHPTEEIDQLRKQLEEFVSKINNRVPFLGTPPAEDVPRLLQFYQYIEDAVRFSIYKVNQDLADFLKEKTGNFHSYSNEDKKRYGDLLENRARLVLDFAIAGAFCGGRFMGEASQAYMRCSHIESVDTQDSLENQLIATLAHKRKEIALGQIEKEGQGDTHYYSAYMANMGPILSLPGTQNVVEHLLKRFDVRHELASFFSIYNENCIIEAVNQKFKTSQSFRTALFDWIKDQVTNWNKDLHDNLAKNKISQIESVLQDKITEPSIISVIHSFVAKVGEIKSRGALPKVSNWDLFLVKFWALDSVKNCSQMSQWRSSLNSLSSDCQAHLYEHITHNIPLNLDPFVDQMIRQQKISELRKIIPLLNNRQVEDLLTGYLDVESLVQDIENQTRSVEFLARFFDEEDEYLLNKDLPKEVMEWLLVSHRILSAQVSEPDKIVSPQLHLRDHFQAYKEIIIGLGGVSSEETMWLSQPESTQASHLIQKRRELSKRYQVELSDSQKALLTAIFKDKFKAYPTQIVDKAYRIFKNQDLVKLSWFYPIASKADLKKILDVTFSASLWILKLALWFSWQGKIDTAIGKLTQRVTALLIPPVINYTPLAIIRASNRLFVAIEKLEKNLIPALVVVWIAREIVSKLPEIPVITNLFKKVDIQNFLIFYIRLKWNQHTGSSSRIVGLAIEEGLYEGISSSFDFLKAQILSSAQAVVNKSELAMRPVAYQLFLQAFSRA